jgi:hypothetical protein
MEAVHVLGRVDGLENFFCVDLFRKRKLDEDAVHIVVAIELANEFEHFVRGDGSRWSVQPTAEAKLFTGGDFAFDIEVGGGIFTNEDGGEARFDALPGETSDFSLEFGEDLIANFESIKDACGHAWLTFVDVSEKNTTT